MNTPIRKIAFAAVVAAAYAALTMFLAPIGYGIVQFRLSEVLCILPFFFPFSVWGLFIGCAIANLLSAFGVMDVVFGSLATLAAAYCTMLIGKRWKGLPACALACLPPVLFNGVIVGGVITLSTAASGAFWTAYAVNGLQIAVEEAMVMYIIGLPVMLILSKKGVFARLKEKYNI